MLKINTTNKTTSLLLLIILFINIILFFIFEYYNNYLLSNFVRMLTTPLLIILYVLKVKKQHFNFWLLSFLIFYSLAFILSMLEELIYVYNTANFNNYRTFTHLSINIAYILAYVFLSTGALLNIGKQTLYKYKYIATLLFIVAVGLSYYMSTLFNTTQYYYPFKPLVINAFNYIVLILFFISALNYVVHGSKKSYYLLLGSLFISISELLQLAHYYMDGKQHYLVFCFFTILLVLGFYFIWKQMLEDTQTTKKSFLDV